CTAFARLSTRAPAGNRCNPDSSGEETPLTKTRRSYEQSAHDTAWIASAATAFVSFPPCSPRSKTVAASGPTLVYFQSSLRVVGNPSLSKLAIPASRSFLSHPGPL